MIQTITKQKIIREIRKIWREQEKLAEKQHRKISRMLKDFSVKELQEILSDEEINLGMEEYYFEEKDEE